MKRALSTFMFVLLLVSTLTFAFNTQNVKASGTIYIRADGSIDPPDAPISTVDNVTYTLTGNITSDADGITVERSNIIIDGAGYALQGSGSGNGFCWSGISNVTIQNTNIKQFYYGISSSFFSNCNSISGNNITSSGYGIYLDSSSNYNSISGNNITANSGSGIYLYYSSNYNSISGNNITANSGSGIYLYSSSNNKFFHNNFINNGVQVYSQNSANVWDDGYPSGGNYWSDYTGIDVKKGPTQDEPGSDGIGDTPYVIDEDNQDNYPLMKPYPWDPHDVGITSVTTSKNIVGQGYTASINVMIFNYGNDTENFNVTAYANTTAIQTKTLTLTSGNSTTLTFTWNTSGFAKGNYTISAYAWPVPGEVDTEDNNRADGSILVTKVGDFGGGVPPAFFDCDGSVDGKDLALFLQCYKGTAPAEAMYLGDLGGGVPPQFYDCNGKVDGKDLSLFLQCYKGLGP